MDTFYLVMMILVTAAAGGVVIYLLVKHPSYLKKYWRYLAGIAGTLLGVLGVSWLVSLFGRGKASEGDPYIERKDKAFREELASLDNESEARMVSVLEKEQEVKEELEAVDRIDDEAERLKRLTALWNRRRGR